MTIGSMFGDIFKSFFKKPMTEKYPFVRVDAPANLRGKLVWDPEKCSGCMLCIKDCPSSAIELLVVDRVNKKFVMRYNVDRCTFCAQCVTSCRFGCIDMSDEMWELASIRKESFEVYYGRDEDIQFLLENAAKGDPEGPCQQ
ncbi:MAG: 4Fe-4S binding protein [Chloroflexi bacterium]|nr:4Fe-4S binding protein [Chloroflexota bacterium]